MSQNDLKKHIESLYKPVPKERRTVMLSPSKDQADLLANNNKEREKKDKLLLQRLRKDLNRYFSSQGLPLLTDKNISKVVNFE